MRTKEEILEYMVENMPYKFIGKEQILPYIKLAMDIYAKQIIETTLQEAADNAMIKVVKNSYENIQLGGNKYITVVNKQSILNLKDKLIKDLDNN